MKRVSGFKGEAAGSVSEAPSLGFGFLLIDHRAADHVLGDSEPRGKYGPVRHFGGTWLSLSPALYFPCEAQRS